MCTFSLYLSLSFFLSLSPSLSLSYFVNMHVHVHLYLLYFLLFPSPPSLSSFILPSPPPLRLGYTVLLQTQEGEECPQMKSLLNDRLDHYPITTPVSYTPRLFHLSSSTGWFRQLKRLTLPVLRICHLYQIISHSYKKQYIMLYNQVHMCIYS